MLSNGVALLMQQTKSTDNTSETVSRIYIQTYFHVIVTQGILAHQVYHRQEYTVVDIHPFFIKPTCSLQRQRNLNKIF